MPDVLPGSGAEGLLASLRCSSLSLVRWRWPMLSRCYQGLTAVHAASPQNLKGPISRAAKVCGLAIPHPAGTAAGRCRRPDCCAVLPEPGLGWRLDRDKEA
jgi:hypothetical protein